MLNLRLFFEGAKDRTLQTLFASLSDDALDKVIEFAAAEEDSRDMKLIKDSVAKRLNELIGVKPDENN